MGADSADNRWMITTPNMAFIPEPSLGKKVVSIRADGHFGLEDPILWPQKFWMEGQWLAAVSHRPKYPKHHLQPIWNDVSLQDFVLSTILTAFGRLCRHRQAELKSLVSKLANEARTLHRENPNRYGMLLPSVCKQMEEAYDHLDLPSTFRDIVQQVRCIQRHYLYTAAILAWYGEICCLSPMTSHPVRPDLMGAFTTDPSIVQWLFSVGVPVWYMRYPHQISRNDVILSFERLQRSSDIVTDDGVFGRVIYQGVVGFKQYFEAITRAGKYYFDIEETPLPERISDGSIVSPSLSKSASEASGFSMLARPHFTSSSRAHSCKLTPIVSWCMCLIVVDRCSSDRQETCPKCRSIEVHLTPTRLDHGSPTGLG